MAIAFRIQRLWQEIAWPLKIFAVSRVGLFLLAYLGLTFLPLNPDLAGQGAFSNNKLLDGWMRWDAGWYRDIAENGYSDKPGADQQRNTVFFPLFPLTIRLFNLFTHNSAVSGVLISNLALGMALLLLFRLSSERYGSFVGRWTVALLVTFPFGFYFSAVYSEALFLLTIIGTFYFGNRKRWGLAAMCAACASATRAVGITASLGLLFLYLGEIGFKVRDMRRDILWIVVSPLGLIAYMSFLWYRFGDPLLFVKARQVAGWEQGMGLGTAWQTVTACVSIKSILSGQCSPLGLLHIGISGLGILVVALAWSKLDLAHTIWAIIFIGVSFVGGWHGMGRYILPVFPVFAGIPLLVRERDKLLAICYVDTLLLALFTIMYSHSYWVS
jgi:hypothetical protein